MPEFIVLCAGAAIDAAEPRGAATHALPPDPFSLEAGMLARELADGVLARTMRRARVAADRSDPSPLPRELPDETWLREHFGAAAGDSVAAWACAALDLSPPRWRVTPVHLEVGHHQIVLADPARLGIDADQAAGLAEAARAPLAEAGFALQTARPDCWFLSGNEDWSLEAHAWTMAVGRSVDGHLPAGAQARAWRRAFTEVQIAWHDHPVNERRATLGLAPINALWLDGCARRPLPARSVSAFTDEPSIAGLAIASGGKARPGIGASDAAAAIAGAGTDVLVDAGFWRAARRNGDVLAWREAWLRFEPWLAALLDAGAPPRGFERMRIVASAERRCVELALARGDRWKLLRRLDAPGTLLAA